MCAAAPASAAVSDPAAERDNRAKERERDAIHMTPQYQQRLSAVSQANTEEAARILAADPERNFLGNLCFTYGRACAGDVRLYQWEANGHGDRKSTRLNSSHANISYAVFC